MCVFVMQMHNRAGSAPDTDEDRHPLMSWTRSEAVGRKIASGTIGVWGPLSYAHPHSDSPDNPQYRRTGNAPHITALPEEMATAG